MKKSKLVAVVASTRAGRRKVGEMVNDNDAPTFEFEGRPAVSLRLARMNGYPAGPGCVREKLVVSGGRVRG